MEPIEDPTNTSPQDEKTRIVRTIVQAVVAGICTWLFTKFGVHVDPDKAVTIVFPIVMGVITAVVHQLGKLPYIGKYILLLNGPRRQVAYAKPAELQK